MTTRLDDIRYRLDVLTRPGQGYSRAALAVLAEAKDAMPGDMAYLLGELEIERQARTDAHEERDHVARLLEETQEQRDALQALEGGWTAQQVADYLATSARDRQALENKRDEALAEVNRLVDILDGLSCACSESARKEADAPYA